MQYERSEKKLKFLQSYFDKYGHLNGVDTQWQKYTAMEKSNNAKGKNATPSKVVDGNEKPSAKADKDRTKADILKQYGVTR